MVGFSLYFMIHSNHPISIHVDAPFLTQIRCMVATPRDFSLSGCVLYRQTAVCKPDLLLEAQPIAVIDVPISTSGIVVARKCMFLWSCYDVER